MQWLAEVLTGIFVLAAVFGLAAAVAQCVAHYRRRNNLSRMLKRHFRTAALQRLAVTDRQFPFHLRADLQRAVEAYVQTSTLRSFTGIRCEGGLGGVEFSSLFDSFGQNGAESTWPAPPQYEQINVGGDALVRCLKNGIWCLSRNGTKVALLYAPLAEFGECGIQQRVRLQIATTSDERGTRAAEEFFEQLEAAVLQARCYRGKVLSLDQDSSYLGRASGLKVHNLQVVRREEVILPPRTLALLDRNVLEFVATRSQLGTFRMATKKGILFYGPPGTGKTHTIRYLVAALPGHTTFLIPAEQVTFLGEYMTLARLLQPSIVVIEDVDLIAKDRSALASPASEQLLNKLLNEMDGLREDSCLVFILTTNRPELLETALSSRPGRIDQAIEFPLPDADGRQRLVRLYAQGLLLPDEVVQAIVKRTEKVSAAFLKEFMRRTAQFHLQRGGTGTIRLNDAEQALEEMLISGGSLNLKLLGAEQRIGYEGV